MNPEFFIDNSALTTVDDADGFTTVITAEALVQCGEVYHIRLAIADGSDQGLSSYVFLEENSFTSPELNIVNDVGQDSSYIEVGCGTLVTLTAEPSVPGNYVYEWNNGETTQSIEVGTGDYIVEVTNDANCALLSDTFHVEVINNVSLDLGNNKTVCLGEEVTLEIANSTGLAPFTYLWSTGETTSSISAPAGDYSLEIFDANNCSAQDQISVIGVERPTAELSGGGTICDGSENGIPIDFVFTGVPPFQFSYQCDSLVINDYSDYFNYVRNTNLQGTYNLISVSDANCTGSVAGDVLVDGFSLPVSKIFGGDILCDLDSTLLTVEVDAKFPYDLYLNNGSYNVLYGGLESNSFSLYVSDPALYSVHYIQDSNGCRSISNEGEALVAIKPYKNPQILTHIDSIVCPIDAPFQMESLVEGGVWFGNGLNYTGVFNPIFAGVGDHWLTYSFPQNCNEVDSVLLTVSCELQLFIPNSFTPNSDDQNELFVIQGKNIIDYEISIFNRWGKKLFYSNDITTSWDGIFEGITVPAGNYSYIIKAYGQDAQFVTKTGNINILK